MFMKSVKIAILAAVPMLAAGAGMADSVLLVREYPVKQEQAMTDHDLTDQLQRQGFQDVSLKRDGNQIQVSGMRKGEELILTYDGAHGRLVRVSGEPALLQQMLDDTHDGGGSLGTNG